MILKSTRRILQNKEGTIPPLQISKKKPSEKFIYLVLLLYELYKMIISNHIKKTIGNNDDFNQMYTVFSTQIIHLKLLICQNNNTHFLRVVVFYSSISYQQSIKKYTNHTNGE